MSGIRLHSKYGVNPTIPICFWCGKDRNEVALLGAAYKGEAPMHMCIDLEPCEVCKQNMSLGITLVEAIRRSDGPEYTGKWMVIKESAVAKIFQPQSVVDEVLRWRRAMLEPDAYSKLKEMFEHAPDEPEPRDSADIALAGDSGAAEAGAVEGPEGTRGA